MFRLSERDNLPGPALRDATPRQLPPHVPPHAIQSEAKVRPASTAPGVKRIPPPHSTEEEWEEF